MIMMMRAKEGEKEEGHEEQRSPPR